MAGNFVRFIQLRFIREIMGERGLIILTIYGKLGLV